MRKTIRDYKTVSVYNLSFELIFIRILRSRVRCRVWAVWRAPTRPHAHASNAAERASRRSTPHLRQHNSPPRPRTTCDALSARPCARRSSRARSAAQPTSPVYINTKTSLRISRVLTVRPGRKLDRLQPAPVQLPSTGSTIFKTAARPGPATPRDHRSSRRICQAARRSEKVSARSRCPRRSSDLATASHACHAGAHARCA